MGIVQSIFSTLGPLLYHPRDTRYKPARKRKIDFFLNIKKTNLALFEQESDQYRVQ